MSLSTPRLVLAILAALVLVMGAALGLAEALEHAETRTSTVREPVGRVVVRADEGDVRLQGVAGPDATVRQESAWLWQRPDVTTRVTGDVLEVEARCPQAPALNRCRADLTLRLPAGLDVVVEREAGDVQATGLAGRVALSTDEGDIDGRALRPASIEARTRAGDVDLAFATTPLDVGAASEAGDVAVTVPRGGDYRLDTRTEDGSVSVQGILRNDRAPRRVSLATDDGDVRVNGRD